VNSKPLIFNAICLDYLRLFVWTSISFDTLGCATVVLLEWQV
jgi:hypothetical protein